MKLSEFIGLLDYDSMVGTDPLDMPICIISPDDEGFMSMSYSGVIRKIPGALLNGEIDNIILPADSDETLTITVDGVVYPNGGMNPSSSEVEDFFTGASTKISRRNIKASQVGHNSDRFEITVYDPDMYEDIMVGVEEYCESSIGTLFNDCFVIEGPYEEKHDVILVLNDFGVDYDVN